MKANLSIEKAVTLLQAAARMPEGASVTALAAASGIPRPTASRLLATMESHGLVQRSEQRDRYVLGFELGRLGRAVDLNRGLVLATRPSLEELAVECSETVTLAVPRPGPSYEVLVQVDAPHLVRVHDWRVDRQPLHATSTGKLLLSELDDDELRAILDQGLERCAPATIVDPDALRAQLAEVRAQGWAEVVDELEDGLAAIAAPVPDGQDRITAVLSVTGPTHRFGPDARAHAVAAARRCIARLPLTAHLSSAP